MILVLYPLKISKFPAVQNFFYWFAIFDCYYVLLLTLPRLCYNFYQFMLLHNIIFFEYYLHAVGDYSIAHPFSRLTKHVWQIIKYLFIRIVIDV